MHDRTSFYRAIVEPKLQPAPFPREWVRSGNPQATAQYLWKSDDGTAATLVWECGAGTFEWHYDEEETVHVIDGEVDVAIEGGPSFNLGAGDTAIFRAGCNALWTIKDRVRKVAIVRRDVPVVVALPMRAWRKLVAIARQQLGGRAEAGLARN